MHNKADYTNYVSVVLSIRYDVIFHNNQVHYDLQ